MIWYSAKFTMAAIDFLKLSIANNEPGQPIYVNFKYAVNLLNVPATHAIYQLAETGRISLDDFFGLIYPANSNSNVGPAIDIHSLEMLRILRRPSAGHYLVSLKSIDGGHGKTAIVRAVDPADISRACFGLNYVGYRPVRLKLVGPANVRNLASKRLPNMIHHFIGKNCLPDNKMPDNKMPDNKMSDNKGISIVITSARL